MAGRLAGGEVPHQIVKGIAGIRNILYHQHMPPFNIDLEVHNHPHGAALASFHPVTGKSNEVNMVRDGEAPAEISHEYKGPLENSHHQERGFVGIIGGDPIGQLNHPVFNHGGVD